MNKIIKHIFAWFMLLFGAASLMDIGVAPKQALAVFMVIFYLIYFGVIGLKEDVDEKNKTKKVKEN